jgi:hypothetical protein
MSRNGSGSYTVPNTMVAGTTITASDHNENYSDIGSEITNSVAADGQTTMTGPLKAASGTVSLPGLTFGADPDTGWYRIAANNAGFAAGGAKVIDVSTTGVAITGTLSATGAVSWTGQITATGGVISGDGTVALPAYSFVSDPDTGFYRIGANNIGVAANGAKVLDIATTGLTVTGSATVSSGFTVSAGAVSLPAATVANAALATDNFATKAQMETGTSLTVAVPPGTMHNHPAMPKAWGYITISGTTATVAAGYGVTSVVFVSGTNWTVTLSTAMSSTNYAVICTTNAAARIIATFPAAVRTTTTFQITFYRTDDSAGNNPDSFAFAVYGDQ